MYTPMTATRLNECKIGEHGRDYSRSDDGYEVDSTELQPGDLVIAVKKNWRHVRVHIKRLVRK